ncbi:PadR family transcriptional regulator [bacterium]|nr:PadR family transcriptional regulator [bacterium]
MILLTRAEEIVLLAVYKLKENAYGVTIREQIHQDISRYWAFGVIYKTLKKMRDKGFVDKISGDPVAERGGRKKYFYRITPEGMKALEEIFNVHASLWGDMQPISMD